MNTYYNYKYQQQKVEELKKEIQSGEGDTVKSQRLLKYYESLMTDTLNKNGTSLDHTVILKADFNKYSESLPQDHIAFLIKFDKWGEIVDEIIEPISIENTEVMQDPDWKDSYNKNVEFGFAKLEGATITNVSSEGKYRGVPTEGIILIMKDFIN